MLLKKVIEFQDMMAPEPTVRLILLIHSSTHSFSVLE